MSSSPWICHDCGKKYGKCVGGVFTMHNGICGFCKQNAGVTHPRNYGYPRPILTQKTNESVDSSEIDRVKNDKGGE